MKNAESDLAGVVSFPRRVLGLSLSGILFMWGSVQASTYYIDFDGGADSNGGTTPAAAFKHSPGDPAATEKAVGITLQPGDTVLFKGGVSYQGQVNVTNSGTVDSPIVFDGNTAGTFGTGKAIIDGSVALTEWKRCASAAEAKGNPRWNEIFTMEVPSPASWDSLHLTDASHAMPIAQDPNPKDPMLQEEPSDYTLFDGQFELDCPIKVTPGEGMFINADRPLIYMIMKPTGNSAVINPLCGGSVNIELPAPVTVTTLGIEPAPNYTPVKDVVFYGDGKELLGVSLERDTQGIQKFKLGQPATFRKLTVKFLSGFPDRKSEWTAICQIVAYDERGANVLEASGANQPHMTLTDPKGLPSSEPGYYKGMIFGFHGGAQNLLYHPVEEYDPVAHRLYLPVFSERFCTPPHYSLFNSVRLIDRPGEYSVEPGATPGMSRVFFMPTQVKDGRPVGVGRAGNSKGIALTAASNIVVQGFVMRRQNGSPLDVTGPGANLVFRDCELTLVRAHRALGAGRIKNILIERCNIHHNPGHTRGIILHTCTDAVTRDCQLYRNTGTALDYYVCTNGLVAGCTVFDNPGMHANGLTFYVGCRDILVERNLVRDGNTALTLQDGENMIIRNNILAGGKSGMSAIGLWAGKPYNNIVIVNNLLLHYARKDNPTGGALYGGNPDTKGVAVINNIIAGLSGNTLRKADLHHNIFLVPGPGLPVERLGRNQLVPDLKSLCVDPDKGDYRLKEGSPAIGAGLALTSITRYDKEDVVRDADGAIDVGPYEYVAPGARPAREPARMASDRFQFTFDGYVIAPPPVFESLYKMRFKKRDGVEVKILKGVERTGEEGGKVSLRPSTGHIAGWNNAGHWLEWTVTVEQAGHYELAIEHASETPSERQILLNGQPVVGLEKMAFPPTGAWSTFEKTGVPVALSLSAGKNVIRFINLSGPLNFKTLEFIPVSVP